jgi:hypothetical protein
MEEEEEVVLIRLPMKLGLVPMEMDLQLAKVADPLVHTTK